MRKLLYCLIFITCSTSSIAQQNHFIYIQTDGSIPFYAKLNNQVYSSTLSGYLIIPKLHDSTYAINLGFAKSEMAEQTFECTIDNKDVGYLLKNFQDKGWGLFDLQTLNITMAGTNNIATTKIVNKTDAFSTLLSAAVDDSTIKQKDSVKVDVQEKLIPVTKEVINKATSSNNASEENNPESIKKSAITKEISNASATGVDLIYTDKINKGQIDTVRIFIPADPGIVDTIVKKQVQPDLVDNKSQPKADTVVVTKEKFIDMNLPTQSINSNNIDNKNAAITTNSTNKLVSNNEQSTPIKSTEDTALAKLITINKEPSEIKTTQTLEVSIPNNINCKATATSDDFLKLRKKMAQQSNDDNMLVVGKKEFKQKCFTTEQIKNLSVLFLTDEGKYQFFDATYPYVLDSSNFNTLQNQLKDNYYISRFRVMVRH